MDVNELLKQGADAYRAGDNSTAYKLFKQAAQADPDNPKALYYLAGVEPDTERKRKILKRLLQIQPDHEKAQALLDRLPPEDEDDFAFDDAPAASSADVGYTTPKVEHDKGVMGIPGAPEKLDPADAVSTFMEIFQSSLAILQRKQGSYPEAVQKASWWRFWLYVGGIYVITAIFSTISNVVTQIRVNAMMNEMFGTAVVTPINVGSILISFIISVPLTIGIMYAGIYASHWWVTNNRGGVGSLYAHGYAMLLPVATVTLITSIVTVIFSFVPFLAAIVGLLSLILAIYALYVSVDGIVMVHKVERNSGYWTIGVAFVAQIIAGIVLGLVAAPFIIGSAAVF